MYCSKCGGLVKDGADKCPECGALVADGVPAQAPELYQPAAYQQSPPANYGAGGMYPYPPPPPQSKAGIAVGVIIGCAVVGLVGVFIFGILAAIAIPSFVKYQNKAKQSEVKTNLGAIFTCQVAYFGEYNTYAQTFGQLGWAPVGPSQYAYYLPGQVIPDLSGTMYSLPAGISPRADDISFMVVAAGNLDGDSALDVWTMDDSKVLLNVESDQGF